MNGFQVATGRPTGSALGMPALPHLTAWRPLVASSLSRWGHQVMTRKSTVPCSCRGVLIPSRSRTVRCQAAADQIVVRTQEQQAPLNPFANHVGAQPVEGLPATLFGLPNAMPYALALLAGAALGLSVFQIAGKNLTSAAAQRVAPWAAVGLAAVTSALTARWLLAARRSAATSALRTLLATLPDPDSLTREAVAGLEAQAGCKLTQVDIDALRTIYGIYVEWVIPQGDTPLTGDEPERLRRFKDALGLDDETAGPVHIEVGRRILRGRLESGSRAEDAAARRTFQKLVYVSYLVFGDRAYVTPWARAFRLTDAQIYVARRDCARMLFQRVIDEDSCVELRDNNVVAGSEDEHQVPPTQIVSRLVLRTDEPTLQALAKKREQLRLPEEEAADLVRAAARRTLETRFARSVELLRHRSRRRELSAAAHEMEEAVAFNATLQNLASRPASMPPGLGAVTVLGGVWASRDGFDRDVRELYRAYIEHQLDTVAADAASSKLDGPGPSYDATCERAADDLRSALGLGPREARLEEAEVKERVYKRLLRAASAQLDAASSPAALLGALVERVGLDSAAAAALHTSLYRQRLTSLLERRGGKLTPDDGRDLARAQRALCVPSGVRDRLHADLCGSQFKGVVEAALSVGPEHFGAADRSRVRSAARELLLDPPVARAVLAELGRRKLLKFVGAAKQAKSEPDAARELSALVEYSDEVLAPLLEELRTPEEREAAARELAEDDTAVIYDLVMSLRGDNDDDRTNDDKFVRTAQSITHQKDINLGKDLDRRERLSLYRTFATHCLQGDVHQGPMGIEIAIARSATEFEKLVQLAEVLALTAKDVEGANAELAEAAFKARAQALLGEGEEGMSLAALTPERLESLETLRQEMRVPEEVAQRVTRGFQNRVLVQGLQAARAQGKLSLGALLELHDAGVDIASLTSREMRLQLFRDGVLERLTDGEGRFNKDLLLHRIPEALGLDPKRAQRVVHETALERRRTTLVQAVSCLRQKREDDCVKALNNLVAVEAAAEAEHALDWSPKEELADLYALYVTRETDEDRRKAVQRCLAISDGDAESLEDLVATGNYKLGLESESETGNALF